MAAADESSLVAILLPGPRAAEAVRRVWDRGDAVAVVDPGGDVAAALARLAPTHVLDGTGAHRSETGRPVPAGVGAVVTTSGTTAAPRLVMLDHAALAHSARAVTEALDLEPTRHRWLACLPLQHIAGLAIVARAHVTGTRLLVHPRFDADAVAAAAAADTAVSLVPTTLARLLGSHPDAVARFGRVLLGGGPVPPELATRARDAGARLVTTYGLTETGGGCVHDGHALRGTQVALAPRTGEILLRGPVVMRGYRATPDQPEPGQPGPDQGLGTDGTLATGDVGRWTPDGRLEVVDRLTDLVISGGVNVSPTRVEAALQGAGVTDVAVAGLPDDEWGERVVAWVVPDATDISLEALRARARDAGLTPAELPREVRTVDAIPRSPGGKVLRARLRDGAAPVRPM